jgi:hypothetical protein
VHNPTVMEYRLLGGSGLGNVQVVEATRLIGICLEVGVNLIDCRHLLRSPIREVLGSFPK